MRLPAAEPHSPTGFLFPTQYLSGTIWFTRYSMVWDWRVSRAGPMPFCWPSCPLLFCLQLFSLSLLFLFLGDEGIYSNEYGSVLLFQCRTNTLKLRWRQGFEDGAMDCLLCRGGEETLRHFVMESRELQEKEDDMVYMEPKHWRRF